MVNSKGLSVKGQCKMSNSHIMNLDYICVAETLFCDAYTSVMNEAQTANLSQRRPMTHCSDITHTLSGERFLWSLWGMTYTHTHTYHYELTFLVCKSLFVIHLGAVFTYWKVIVFLIPYDAILFPQHTTQMRCQQLQHHCQPKHFTHASLSLFTTENAEAGKCSVFWPHALQNSPKHS